MFGLPIWSIQLIIAFLRAIGAVNLAEALAIKLIVKIKSTVENLKTYEEYPTGKNGQQETNPPSVTNINKG